MPDNVFCTLADVKAQAPINAAWNGFDERINVLIVGSTVAIKSFCRRTFEKAERIEYFKTPDTYNNLSAPSYKIRVAEAPIWASPEVLTVDYDPTGMFGTTTDLAITLTKDTDYIVDYEKGIIEFFTLLEPNTRGLRVTYTGGYEIQTANPNPIVKVPATVKNCCALQTVFTLQRIASMSLGEEQTQRASRSLNRFSVSAQTGLLSELQGLLATYRQPLVGSR